MKPTSSDPSPTPDNSGEVRDELTGHLYDGIQEYDNPLPAWWKWLFVATILFSFPYYAYYHFGASGRSLSEQYQVAEAENARKQLAGLGEIRPDRETLVRFASQGGGALAVGRSIYQANCIACHGPNGGGLVGPNLTDDHYKNVREIEDILGVINKGAAGGAMPAWLNRLDESERVLVSAYVASMRGQDPGPNPRPAEGNVIPPWPVPEPGAASEEAAVDEAEGADEGADESAGEGAEDAVEEADEEGGANESPQPAADDTAAAK
jgi:cytochrome c oxidase cbb3-type subunit 3